MSSAPRLTRLTVAEYLAIERAAEFRSELDDGRMIPLESTPRGMAGARLRHGRIVNNLATALTNQLDQTNCEVVTNDLRTAVPQGNFVYPDIVVICGEPQLLDEQFDTLLNPRVVIEILSPSTESRDRGRKFDQYRQTPTLEHYVLIGSLAPTVERFSRQPDGSWPVTVSAWPDGALELPGLPVAIPLAAIYRRVNLPELPT